VKNFYLNKIQYRNQHNKNTTKIFLFEGACVIAFSNL
jgi:hypothetical protein